MVQYATIAASFGIGALVLVFLIKRSNKRRRLALIEARRAKYGPSFTMDETDSTHIQGRQTEDLNDVEVVAYDERGLVRNQNVQFLRLLVSDLFEDEELDETEEEQQRAALVEERQAWIEENEDQLDQHAALVEEEEIGSGVSVMEIIAPEDDDIEERLEREGGKGGQVQVSLAWDDYNDLDMHVFCPSGERIYFNNKISECGGELDVDMNVRPVSNNAVENVVWTGNAPVGKYKIGVHFYKHHRKRRSKRTVTFRLRVMVHGKSRDYSGTITAGNAMQMVTSFTLKGPEPSSEEDEHSDQNL